jgi:hypothetical protein
VTGEASADAFVVIARRDSAAEPEDVRSFQRMAELLLRLAGK